MKNYYDQKHELNIAYIRLKSLKERKRLYFEATQPKASRYDEPVVMSSVSNDMYSIYVGKIENIDKCIKEVEEEIDILEHNLRIMELTLRKLKGSIEKIFVAKYIDGLTINQMCRKFNYSRPQIYRKLNIIKKILNITKDETK